jgi:hypothetical protein
MHHNYLSWLMFCNFFINFIFLNTIGITVCLPIKG